LGASGASKTLGNAKVGNRTDKPIIASTDGRAGQSRVENAKAGLATCEAVRASDRGAATEAKIWNTHSRGAASVSILTIGHSVAADIEDTLSALAAYVAVDTILCGTAGLTELWHAGVTRSADERGRAVVI
jgi:hypothetical protein